MGSLHRDGGGFQSGGVSVQPVQQLDLEFVGLCPAGNHAVQHLTPVLRLGSAGAGVEGDNGGAVVVLADHQRLDAHPFRLCLEVGKLGFDLGQAVLVVFLDCHFCQRDSVLQPVFQIRVLLNRVLGLLDGLQYAGRPRLIAPEIGGKRGLLQFFNLGCQRLDMQCLTQLLYVGTHPDQFPFGFL